MLLFGIQVLDPSTSSFTLLALLCFSMFRFEAGNRSCSSARFDAMHAIHY